MLCLIIDNLEVNQLQNSGQWILMVNIQDLGICHTNLTKASIA